MVPLAHKEQQVLEQLEQLALLVPQVLKDQQV
jgi:hypothetical protein